MYLTIERAELIKDTLESLLRDKELVLVSIPDRFELCHYIEITTLYKVEVKRFYPSREFKDKYPECEGKYRIYLTYYNDEHSSNTVAIEHIAIEHIAIDRKTQVIKMVGINASLLISPLRKTKYTLQKFCNAYDILTEMDAFGMWDST